MNKKIAIIGGGTASLFFASFIDTTIYDVTIYERKSSLGRKFLVAGDGGFNLTHAEDISKFKLRYTTPLFLDKALSHFNNEDLRAWLSSIGITTFVGSSGRIFPVKGIKPIEVLKTIEMHLINRNVNFKFNNSFTGWSTDNKLVLDTDELIEYDYAVFALGGASWKVTGSDGEWINIFQDKKIGTRPFRASNCAYKIVWNEAYIQAHEGQPLKNIAITIKNKTQKGEVVITKFGIEGNAIYALSPEVQDSIAKKNMAIVHMDLKPSLDTSTIIKKLTNSKTNISTSLKEKLKLSRPLIDLIKTKLSKEEYLDIKVLSEYIKALPLTLIEAAPLDEAISTSGGIKLSELNNYYELINLKDNFCIGEMIDWNAPTGGYLIQGCASMGAYLAHYLNHK